MSVSISLVGGLCNRLFQIAAIMGYAEKYNYNCKLYETLMYDNHHTSRITTLNIIKNIFPDLVIDSNQNIKEEDFDVIYEIDGNDATNYIELKPPPTSTSNILLKGYFQCEKYFPKNNIFLNKIINQLKNEVNEMNYDFTNTYFLHIRMGDYLGSFLHYLGYNKYLSTSIDYIMKINPEANFLICSNEIDKNKIIKEMGEIYNIKNIKYKFELDLNLNLEPLTTLCNMGRCKGGICLNSSFSWIGGYLCHLKDLDVNDKNNVNKINSQKCIIFPNKWFNEKYIPYSRYKDIYPSWDEVKIMSI